MVTSSPPAPHRPSEWGKLGDTYMGFFSLNLGEISFFPFILQLRPPGIKHEGRCLLLATLLIHLK